MKFETAKLIDFASFSQGLQVPIQHQFTEYADDRKRFIRIVDITSGGNEPPRYIVDPGERYFVNESDLFMIRYGSPQVAKGWEGVIANNLFKIKLNSNNLDTNWLYYYLKQDWVNQYLLGISVSATMPAISFKAFGALKVIHPPLPTQRKIASILTAYDDLIENNLKRIKLLEEKAQLHYKELMQEMSYSKTKREEYIKDCLAFYIGGGWGEEDYKEGFTEPAFVIRGTDIPDAKKGEVKSVPFRYHKESNLASRSMLAGDIVFEVSGGSKGQPVGRSILITEKMLQHFGKPVMCASFCKMLRPKENVTPEFFYLYLLASHENGIIAQYEKHSASNIVNYGFEEFIGEQKIKIPKETELKAFTEKAKPIFTLISTLGEQNSKLREARDILMPKLMNGQIEV
jgi:type I restriction enzyme S subunit